MNKPNQSPNETGCLKAAAIKYQSAESIPSLLSSGTGETAQKIVALAEKHGIPVQEDPSLAALLDQVPDGATVPDMAFSLIAEVLCFLYEMDVKWREEHNFMADIVEE